MLFAWIELDGGEVSGAGDLLLERLVLRIALGDHAMKVGRE